MCSERAVIKDPSGGSAQEGTKGFALSVASYGNLLRSQGPTGAAVWSVGSGVGLRDARQTPGSRQWGRAVLPGLPLPEIAEACPG